MAEHIDRQNIVEELTVKGLKGEIDWLKGLEERIRLLRGISLKQALIVAENMRLTEGIETVIKTAKDYKFQIAIITAGFDIVANRVRRILDIDYSIHNRLIFRNRILHGVKVSVCDNKGSLLKKLASRLNIEKKNIIAVGDGSIDLGMFKESGLKIAYRPKSEEVRKAADYVIKDVIELVEIIENSSDFKNRIKSGYRP